MKQEDKDLLLRDLCCRLPYRVKVHYDMSDDPCWDDDPIGDDNLRGFSCGYFELDCADGVSVENIKPYLRPLSSMTDAERDELFKVMRAVQYDGNEMCVVVDARLAEAHARWYDKNMFDHRGLLQKGLALERRK